MILGRILFLIEFLTKILMKHGNWFFRSFSCSNFKFHSSINQAFCSLRIKPISFCEQDNNRNCAPKNRLESRIICSSHTSTSSTFIKEIQLCACDWSAFIIHWNAEPTQDLFRCTLMLPFRTYQIACRLSPRVFLVEHFCTKFLTLSNSVLLPTSKPHESWKTNAILLSNIISFSISCSPLCHIFSKM